MGTPHYIAYISASDRYFSILIWWTVTLDISLSTHTIIFNKKLHTFSTVPNFVKEGIFHFFENCDFLQQKLRNGRASSGLKLVNGIILLCQINHSSHKHLTYKDPIRTPKMHISMILIFLELDGGTICGAQD